jgi:hypothetical protein
VGIRLLSSSGSKPPSGKPGCSPGPDPLPPEPNPARWTILETTDINGWCVVSVHYPGCTTYEGNKLLVYACTSDVVRSHKILDPHFLDDLRPERIYPIARFEPTAQGRRLAELLCQIRDSVK